MSVATSPAVARARGRVVTYGVVVLMAVAVLAGIEAWPVTSFRLFSNVRTSTQSTLVLFALDDDGGRTLVPMDLDQRSVLNTQRQLADLKGSSDARRRAMVDAWLVDGGLDPADVSGVLVQRVKTETDRDGGPDTELERTDVVEFPLT